MFNARSTRTLLAAGTLALVAAAPAAADSVAYVKDGNVWLTTTDGARQFQVTTTGGYSTVSQADDGSLVATNAAHHLVHMDHFGAVLSDISALSGQSAGSYMTFDGPFDADVSPDGTKTAYGFYHTGFTQDYSGNIGADSSNATAVTKTGESTSIATPGYKYLNEWDAPEWIDGENLLVSNGPGYPSDPIAVSKAGSGDEHGWFTDPKNVHPMDATISRNKRMIAAVGGPDRLKLHVYRDQDGQLLGDVSACFFYNGEGTYKYSSPTFNADGTKLWWATGNGLDVAPIGDMSTTCADGVDSQHILPGASSPDWGPADVPTSRPATNGGGGGGGGGGGVIVDPAPAFEVKVAPAKLRKAVRKGLKLRVTAPAAGPVAATARLGTKVVGLGSANAKSAGPATVKVRFTKAGARKLTKARSAALTLTVTAGSKTTTVSARLVR